MKLLSLFDGSGGFLLAGEMCGIEPVYASEIEPYPIAVSKSHFPNVKHLGDICKIKGSELEPVDIITFGSPCQNMSIAGNREGIKHITIGSNETTQSGLFIEAIRVIKEMRLATNGVYPRYAVWENVCGAFNSNKGEDFRTVLEEFIRISEPNAVMPKVPKAGWAYADCISGNGWSIAYRTFDAQYWGVPQRRRRIYLVADFRGGRAKEILFEQEGLRWHTAQSGTQGQETARCAKNSVGTAIGGVDRYNQSFLSGLAQTLRASGGGDCTPTVLAPVANAGDNRLAIVQPISDGGCSTLFENHGRDCRYKGPLKVAPTVTATYGMGGNNTPFVVSVIETSETVHCYDIGEARLRTPSEYIEKSPTLRAEAHGNAPYALKIKNIVIDNIGGNAEMAKQDAYTDMFVVGKEKNVAGPVHYIVRRLTPTECARLQGFPSWWGIVNPVENLTDEDYTFWLGVRNTYAEINGKATKEYTKQQMLSWYNKLHSDSAEYKMWGNGIALPNALYVMQGISWRKYGKDYRNYRS